jgi:hypothetical protein
LIIFSGGKRVSLFSLVGLFSSAYHWIKTDSLGNLPVRIIVLIFSSRPTRNSAASTVFGGLALSSIDMRVFIEIPVTSFFTIFLSSTDVSFHSLDGLAGNNCCCHGKLNEAIVIQSDVFGASWARATFTHDHTARVSHSTFAVRLHQSHSFQRASRVHNITQFDLLIDTHSGR